MDEDEDDEDPLSRSLGSVPPGQSADPEWASMADFTQVHDELIECRAQLEQMEAERDAAVADKDDLLNSYNQVPRRETTGLAAALQRERRGLILCCVPFLFQLQDEFGRIEEQNEKLTRDLAGVAQSGGSKGAMAKLQAQASARATDALSPGARHHRAVAHCSRALAHALRFACWSKPTRATRRRLTG